MKIFSEITIDETGIIEQIDKVREICDRFENEALKLRGMLATGQAKAVTVKERAEQWERSSRKMPLMGYPRNGQSELIKISTAIIKGFLEIFLDFW